MDGSIDGGWIEADDVPPKRPGPEDADDRSNWCLEYSPPNYGDEDEPVLEEKDFCDPSSDFQVEAEVHPKDQSPLSDSERQSVGDSVQSFVKFAIRRLIALTADHALPVAGGRAVDFGFEIWDVATSIRALDSDHPVLEAPLPSPIPEIGFTLEIPLTSGEDFSATPPLALCVAPDFPSLTGDWALDAAEHDDQQEQEPSSDAREAALERLYSQQDFASRPTATIETSQAAPRCLRSDADPRPAAWWRPT